MDSFTRSRVVPDRVAVVYASAPGIGGLGQSISGSITALADGKREVYAIGPSTTIPWSLPGGTPPAIWNQSPSDVSPTWRRWRPKSSLNLYRDRNLGRWAAQEVEKLQPQSCYLYAQAALETLAWAKSEGVDTVLDNPNGHIAHSREVWHRESERWFGRPVNGHVSPEIVARAEQEYRLADRVRVYSQWARRSMLKHGVPAEKIHVLRQTVNLERFRPAALPPKPEGPLRICYVGNLDLRKGFVYLLQAVRRVGARHIRLRIAGAAGDRDCARLYARESSGLEVELGPGDALPVYQQAELMAVPSLEDGLPFALLEGMACGLPAIVSGEAGAAECVRPGSSGWVVGAAQVESIAAALEQALERREDLRSMGREARAGVERYAGARELEQLSEWYYSPSSTETILRR
jgi:glycosyltransferase involved in cell wall biosynthesis